MRISDYINGFEDLITNTQNYIFHHAETGYREYKTAKYLEDIFESLGYTLCRADGIPGFYTVVDTGREGPEVLILGELDSILCAEHPNADKTTGAAHTCGHSAQCAALVGIAAALSQKGALSGLCGKIRLCAVPAEELIEIEYRKNLKAEGKITYMGGKPEFLRRGYFDGVDLAFMVHTRVGDDVTTSACTDMGDLSVLMPVVHPYAPGATGLDHGKNYFIKDTSKACVMSSKWQLEMLRLLLENGAERAKHILADFKPLFPSKQEYFEYIDSFTRTGDRITHSDSDAQISL